MYSSLYFIPLPPGLGPIKKGPRLDRREAPMPLRPPSAENAGRTVADAPDRTQACGRPASQVASAGDVAPRLTPVSARTSPRGRCALSASRRVGATMNALEVHNLRKEFTRRDSRGKRRVAALKGLDFVIERGECVAILGPNGSGKSTLVRLLSTLLLPDGGTATVFGRDAFKDTRAVQRMVNRVSVEASFFKKMSAVENLSYAARFYGLRPHQTKDKIPEILTRVGFPADRRTEPMENLSRGMQQKVALARALLTAPILLLLDEPTTGLDPRSKQEVQEFIREVRAEHDATVLLCTHDMAEAESLADRVGILERGGLVSLEPVEKLLARYGASSLEDAFLAATGAAFETEDEDDREVFA